MEQVSLIITISGVGLSIVAMVLAFVNLGPMRRITETPRALSGAELQQLALRIQISMACGLGAGASQIWQDHIGIALIWMGFFLAQFRNWQLLAKHS